MSDYIETLDGFEKTLPSNWYLDPDIFALEREHIFMREWLCVGREEQFPNSGPSKVCLGAFVTAEPLELEQHVSSNDNTWSTVHVHSGLTQ